MNTKAGKWLAAAAIILAAQHEEDPSGIELNIQGAKLRLTFEGISNEDDEDEFDDEDDFEFELD